MNNSKMFKGLEQGIHRIANKHEKIKNLNDNQENANFLRYHLWSQAHCGSTHSYIRFKHI